ncbi:MAG: thioredoxin domain-containing protein [archaeon]
MSSGRKLDFYGTRPSAKKSPTLKYALVVGAAFILTLLFLSGFGGRKPGSSASGANPFPEYTDNGTRISFVEFSDFECPYCARIQSAISLLKTEYSGRVNFVFKHFPVHGATAQKAAEATECARDQALFEKYHLRLFENQQSFSAAKLTELAASVGADSARFFSCLDSGEKASVVSADYNKGLSVGIQATPTFFVNGAKIEGAVDISVFRKAIEAALAETPEAGNSAAP